MSLVEPALLYLHAGLSVLPARLVDKYPSLGQWKQYQSALPSEDQVTGWFADAEAVCVVTGAVSGNLEMIDFDQRAELFEPWCALIREHDASLLERIVRENSQSGGCHVVYRSAAAIPKNDKLAQRKVFVGGPDQVDLNGKKYKPRKELDGRWSVILTLIETRGEGGLFLCAPSPGYDLVQGAFENLPVLTSDEREILVDAARSLNEHIPAPDTKQFPTPHNGQRPGDDFNRRGDVRALLMQHGWSLEKPGENEYWRRPGKARGCSATLRDNVFYVFSSNAAPFECSKAYSPFGVYARLEHDGDYARAAAELSKSGFGQSSTSDSASPPINGGDDASADLPAQILTPAELFSYNVSEDPNTLLGDRWLCRGGSCLIVGQTGLGKSSFSMQAMITWALGKPLFGITPKHPLRSLIIQAENDVGDLAEMFRGVVNGIDCFDRLDELQSMLTFVSDASRCGKAFHVWAHALISKYQPDLVWIDPLFAFLGGSASDQEVVSRFLRNGLGDIAQKTRVTWMIIHHSNKPTRDPDLKNAAVASDYAYLSSGSSELANWPRAVLTLRELQDGLFELRAPKRGRRAGLVDENGQPATEIYLKHGERGICWERSTAHVDDRNEVDAEIADEIIAKMEVGKVYSKAEIRKLVETNMKAHRSTITTPGRPANRVWRLVMEATRCQHQPGFFAARGSAAMECGNSCKDNEANDLSLPRSVESKNESYAAPNFDDCRAKEESAQHDGIEEE